MIKLSLHADRQLNERDLSLKDIESVINKPDQLVSAKTKGRKIAQKIIFRSKIKFLYRVVYVKEGHDFLVITAYRTTKIEKYWEGELNENKL
ncbi:DUF4258 domain-containing protein [Candidatus Saganbacteria bacterium]|nr:DUF4258 domain-containing protein [Candidatus Saganbacteria bacterium]